MSKFIAACLAATALMATGAVAADGDAPRPKGALTVVQRVDALGDPAREPSLIVAPAGELFVAGYGAAADGKMTDVEPRIWRSGDNGARWARLAVGAQAQGVVGNSDTSLARAPDGTLYFATLLYDPKRPHGKPETGDQMSVGASRDGGRTWKWTNLSKNPLDDRGWVAVGPDGAAHVVWNDGDHVFHAMSADDGQSWSKPVSILDGGGGSSHLAIGPNGHIAVRVSPTAASGSMIKPGQDLLLVSADGGRSWRTRKVPGQRQWGAEEDGGVPRWVEPLAWDARGALYLLWNQADGLHLGRSRDDGVSWKTWLLARTEGDDLMYFPYLIARGDGRLAATWYRGGADAVSWQAAMFRVGDRIEDLRLSKPVLADAWKRSAAEGYPRIRDAAGEYTGLAWTPDGGIGVVTPIQDSVNHRFGFTYRRLAPAR